MSTVENDDRAFDEAFEVMLAVAVRMARRILGNDSTVEDIAAETLARAYAHWDDLVDAAYRDAWVSRVAANLAVDLRRRARPWSPGRWTSGPDERVTARLVVRDALALLSRRQREVVALCLLGEYTEAEAARALCVSAGTVKTHLHRGRAAIRAYLGSDLVEVAHVRP